MFWHSGILIMCSNLDICMIIYAIAMLLPSPMVHFSAVYFELQDYDQCIATCEKAVDVGRENRADYKNIAK